MTSGIYRVSWGGPGNIVWEKLAESDAQAVTSKSVVGLTSSVAAIASPLAAGLSLAGVVQNAMILSKLSVLQREVSSVKARFDLLFLDRSLEYFQDAHRDRIGLDPHIADALRQDCLNALTQMVQDKNLWVPAFLRHRCLILSSSVSRFGQLTYALLHDGSLNILQREAIQAWTKNISSLKGVAPDGGYVPQSDILVSWNDELGRRGAAKKHGSLVERFSPKDLEVIDEACAPGNFDRCTEILYLYRDLEAYIRYTEMLAAKPRSENKKEILFKLVS